MNDKILTPAETWKDFWRWIKDQPEWEQIKRDRKQYLYKTDMDVSQGKAGIRRLRNIFNEHAPGRYEFSGGFIIHEEK